MVRKEVIEVGRVNVRFRVFVGYSEDMKILI